MYYRMVNSGYGLQYLPYGSAGPVPQGGAAAAAAAAAGIGTGLPSPTAPMAAATAPGTALPGGPAGLGVTPTPGSTPGLPPGAPAKWVFPNFSSTSAIQYLVRVKVLVTSVYLCVISASEYFRNI